MDRKELLQQAFDRSAVLHLDSSQYREFVSDFFALQLRCDLGTTGDITSRVCIKNGTRHTAVITARSAGVIAGLEEMEFLYTKNGLIAKQLVQDGQRVKKNTPIMEVTGDMKALLMFERIAVNALQRMSGIATLAAKLVKLSDIPIAATRKTFWGFLDKKAVFVGGGLTHRLNAEEAILIKSNHIDAMHGDDPVKQALTAAWARRQDSIFIEIEARDIVEAIAAAKVCAELQKQDPEYPLLIMLDNFTPKEIRATVTKLRQETLYHAALLEASGGITADNIVEFSKTGVDVLSLGVLTHSAPVLDLAQKIR